MNRRHSNGLSPRSRQIGSGTRQRVEGTLPGVDKAVDEFVATLREAKVTLGRAGARIAAARVDDDAFGKLFEAGEVRAAYHTRLPAAELDIATAGEVLGHFISGLT